MCDSAWDREWDRLDAMGQFTMDQCCEMADEATSDNDDDSSSDDDDD